jgi:hypothetical protein
MISFCDSAVQTGHGVTMGWVTMHTARGDAFLNGNPTISEVDATVRIPVVDNKEINVISAATKAFGFG